MAITAVRSHARLLSMPESLKVYSENYDYVVQDLIAERTVNILIGDSGIGKSALVHQLAVCRALGLPFLGMPVKKGPVVVLDRENSGEGPRISATIAAEMFNIDPEEDDNFIQNWHFFEDEGNIGDNMRSDLAPLLASFKKTGSLVVIDSLRMWDPKVEAENAIAGEKLASLTNMTKEHNATILFIHHTRKEKHEKNWDTPTIESAPLSKWLEEASGVKALVNQSFTRIGVAKPGVLGTGDDNPAALVMKAMVKTRGEIGPVYIKRVFAEDDLETPKGYEVMHSADLITSNQRKLYDRLPENFTYKDVKETLGTKNNDKAAKFVKLLVAAGAAKSLGTKKGFAKQKLEPTPRSRGVLELNSV